jgi:hypothetical protein
MTEEIYPEEFAEFFKAMSAKMLKASEEKGDTWKDATAIYDIFYRYSTEPPAYKEMPMQKWLEQNLKSEVDEYFENADIEELVDIANFCAMLWCRKHFLETKK